MTNVSLSEKKNVALVLIFPQYHFDFHYKCHSDIGDKILNFE